MIALWFAIYLAISIVPVSRPAHCWSMPRPACGDFPHTSVSPFSFTMPGYEGRPFLRLPSLHPGNNFADRQRIFARPGHLCLQTQLTPAFQGAFGITLRCLSYAYCRPVRRPRILKGCSAKPKCPGPDRRERTRAQGVLHRAYHSRSPFHWSIHILY
ncbi:hypothetical protein BU26DRAFT_246830 [Trematosphaeria pertusa]|uniref:Secreted protein n=1 Tax=Trematosphaeria pertusa TaxID=390896 RepID=A0A6A6INU3_9PLEO|nr:uncharacterized protein BU26DRAFT_246830 [Trematosphaeria pertusa]KAF2251919.1 hypothetical protein BU26DRAFT_246830 [Trematosphaeria pertusa]